MAVFLSNAGILRLVYVVLRRSILHERIPSWSLIPSNVFLLCRQELPAIVNFRWTLFSTHRWAGCISRFTSRWGFSLRCVIYIELDLFADLMRLTHVRAVLIERLILTILHAEALETLLWVIKFGLRQEAFLPHLNFTVHHLD